MKTITIAMVLLASSAGLAWSQSQHEANLYENTVAKQTDKDFKPAPATIDTHFGRLDFINGAYPDEASTQRIYDEMDLQRATQAYMDFYPALSLYAIVSSQIRDFGLKSSSDVAVMADFLTPTELYLTGNDITVYAVASLDLKVDGRGDRRGDPARYDGHRQRCRLQVSHGLWCRGNG